MPDSPEPRIAFHLLKASGFRVVHVDGAHGGITPQGKIFTAIYSERPALPQAVVHSLGANGKLGDEILGERKTRGGIVRELEVGLTMDLAVAEGIHQWLGTKIDELKKLAAESKTGTV